MQEASFEPTLHEQVLWNKTNFLSQSNPLTHLQGSINALKLDLASIYNAGNNGLKSPPDKTNFLYRCLALSLVS